MSKDKRITPFPGGRKQSQKSAKPGAGRSSDAAGLTDQAGFAITRKEMDLINLLHKVEFVLLTVQDSLEAEADFMAGKEGVDNTRLWGCAFTLESLREKVGAALPNYSPKDGEA